MMEKDVKVLLVEDHEIVRQGLKMLLDGHSDIQIIGDASNGSEALQKLNSITPDVILMDMNMPVMNGFECTKIVKEKHPDIKILILSMHDSEKYLIDMLDAGAEGYVLKNTSREELILAIKKVASNGTYIGSEFTMGLINKKNSSTQFGNGKPQIAISEREREVLLLISEGLTNADIAKKLFTSIRTIETRRKRLLEKTGTTNTATLIRYAVKNGLVN